jgi:hypothetical protein
MPEFVGQSPATSRKKQESVERSHDLTFRAVDYPAAASARGLSQLRLRVVPVAR